MWGGAQSDYRQAEQVSTRVNIHGGGGSHISHLHSREAVKHHPPKTRPEDWLVRHVLRYVT